MAAPRKDNVREKIMDAAETLLQTDNLSDITLAEIAALAGVSKGTLYYHYKDKTEILFGLTDRYLDKQWDELVSWTENKEKDTSIHRLVKYVVERNVASAGIRLHLLNAAMLGDEETRRKLIDRYSQFETLISQKIAERTDAVGADYLTWLILLASDGLIVQKAIRNDRFDTEEFIRQSAAYLRQADRGEK
ncbi:MAG TPA: TetR/AcrR family transcriptional regulator [Oscillospiraceae bacterium]|nr:TetR/AcrR family transcriptional regulator [Oscillospiraceae bacterium]HPS76209.1 TetR/AcrR family transcriptional regulator [Oscillospiraceae bacterium]